MLDERIKKIIKTELQELASKRFQIVDEIRVEDLDFNPYLLCILGFETPEEIAEFMVAQRVERSIVTSYGQRIQKIAKEIAGRGTGVEGADICKEVRGRRYYIQVKAGPNTINKDISSEINRLLSSAIRRNHGSVALLGMTYGKRDRVSSIIQRYSQIDWLIGREFWAFISDDPDCAKKIYEIAREVVQSIPDGGRPYRDRYKAKVQEIANEIRRRYGDGPGMWDRLFEDNM